MVIEFFYFEAWSADIPKCGENIFFGKMFKNVSEWFFLSLGLENLSGSPSIH